MSIAVLIFVKLSRNPWLSLSCPATGYAVSIPVVVIELALAPQPQTLIIIFRILNLYYYKKGYHMKEIR